MRKQLQVDVMWCYFDAFLTLVKPKNYKEALLESSWIEPMQEEIHEFERLQVWELVPRPDYITWINLKLIFKVQRDEFGGVLKNKARLVAKGFRQEEGINFEESFTPIFRYLKGTPNMDLWYSKDIGIALTAYADADHAGCQDTGRSTSGSAQFLSDRLVSWSLKKQKSTAISSTEAKYIALSGCSTADAPEIYMQQFYHSVSYDLTAKAHFFKIDDQIFEVNTDLLRNSLRITPKDPDHPFTLPAPEKEIIAFINELGKATTYDRPRLPMLQILWGIVTGNNLDTTLGNLKFANKGEMDPVFGMAIPVVMLNDDINAIVEYSEYLAKSRGSKPVKTQGKGLLTKQGVEV
ncbi:retrovirus-related pol polyprotein from transposon TNT 1-94 [Tanacetum coccineum]